MSNEFSSYWAILADKGYHDLQDQIRNVIYKKKPINGCLTVADKNRNKAISHDRIVVENYFGHLCTFGLFSQKCMWKKRKRDIYFQNGVALTNANLILICFKPLILSFIRQFIVDSI